MANKIIVANLKMNLLANDLNHYLEGINKLDDRVVICPTNIYIPYFLNKQYKVGLQNIYFESSGAYTGEVSAIQAKSLGIDYVLVGHSERRTIFNEDDKIINQKLKSIVKNKMHAILCIGETKLDYEANKTLEVISNQINWALSETENLDKVIIAYEPIWSIGTGIVPKIEEIITVTNYIKEYILNNYQINMPVLYGGSVNENNINELNSIEQIDGFLIGGASLDSHKLANIVEVVF